MEQRTQSPAPRPPRERAARHAAATLVALVWLVGVLDPGAVPGLAGAHGRDSAMQSSARQSSARQSSARQSSAKQSGPKQGAAEQKATEQKAAGQKAAGRADALAPLTVDPWRDPPWRMRLVPGIGKTRAGRLVAARSAAGGLPWQSLEDLAWLDEVDASTLRALLAVCAREPKPGRTPPVRLTLGAGALRVR